MRRAPSSRVTVAAVCALASLQVALQSSQAEESGGTFNFLWENDVVAATDQHYTNGLEFSYLSIEDHLWNWFRTGSSVLPGVAREDHLRVGIALGQSIFTPDNTDATQPLPDERPYAGWLYAGVSVIADHDDQLDTWVLNLGVVGPSAYGEQVQNGFHDKIHDSHANGWANQLHDEFGYQLLYEHRWRHVQSLQKRMGPLQLDLSPHLGFSLGNIATYANAGITLRLGKDLSDDYGVPRIRPSLPGSAFFQPVDGSGWYVFAGIDGRAVAHNIFLDGNTDGNSLSVDKETFVLDAQAGFAIIWSKFRFAYTYVVRSHEFKTQQQPDRFGSVGLSARF